MENNIPKLRFKEFTDEWQEKKLGDIAGVSSGGTPSRTKPEFWSGTIPWVTTSQINFNLIYNATQFITSAGLRSSAAKIFPVGTVLVALYGQGITRGKVSVLAIDASTNQACAAILADQKFAKSKFLFYFLARQYGSLRKLSNDGSQKNLSGDLLKKLKIVIPNIAEQEKIAGFLTAVDEKIGRLEEKKKGFEKYKKGVMQAIFSQKIRFRRPDGSNFPDWEDKKLGELLNYEQPTKYIVRSTEYRNDYKIPVLTAGKTFILGYTNEADGIYNDLPVIIFDDFTTTNQFVNFPFKVKSSAMKILKAKGDANIKFVFEVMQQIRYEIGGHGRHWISVFSNFDILVPSKEEQEKIAEFLTSLDNKVELINKELEQAKIFKKSLLQQMFI